VQSNGRIRLSFTDMHTCEQPNDAKVEGIADIDLAQSFDSGSPHTSGNVVWVNIVGPNDSYGEGAAKGRVLVRVCHKMDGSGSSFANVGLSKRIGSKVKTMSTRELRVGAVAVWFVAMFMYFSPLREVRMIGVVAAVVVSAASAFLRTRASATVDVQLVVMKVYPMIHASSTYMPTCPLPPTPSLYNPVRLSLSLPPHAPLLFGRS
jgi:hypothetical protein